MSDAEGRASSGDKELHQQNMVAAAAGEDSVVKNSDGRDDPQEGKEQEDGFTTISPETLVRLRLVCCRAEGRHTPQTGRRRPRMVARGHGSVRRVPSSPADERGSITCLCVLWTCTGIASEAPCIG